MLFPTLLYIPVTLKLVLVNEKTAPILRGGFHFKATIINKDVITFYLIGCIFAIKNQMKQLFVLLCFPVILFSCGNNGEKTEKISLPPKPGTADEVLNTIKGKNYSADKIATLSPFEMDVANPYTWFDELKDTATFTKNFLKENLAMKLQFKNDTAVTLIDDNKKTEAIYKLDTAIKDEEKPGIKLRISYPDSSLNFFGVTEPMIMTYTFYVQGIDEKKLLLETPRSYNNRKVITLLSSK